MIFLELLINGQLLQDDWSIAENNFLNNGLTNTWRTNINGFITRPIAALIFTLQSSFEYDYYKYFLTNISFYFIFNIIIYKIFLNKYNHSISIILVALLMFPNLNSTNIFSPAAQSLGTFSLLLWSISFYLIYFGKQQNNYTKIKISWVFFFLSVLTYEISFVLILFNIFFDNEKILLIIKNIFTFKVNKLIKFKEIQIFIFILFLIVFYQLIITKFFTISSSNRYRFLSIDTLSLIIQYSHLPITIIIDTITLYKDSIYTFSQKLSYNLILLFFIIIVTITIKKKDLLKHKVSSNKNFLLITTFSYFLLLIFFIIAKSLPFIDGYYNRAMGAYNFIFSLFIIILIINFPINTFFKKFFLIIVIFLNLNLFIAQIESNVIASKFRNSILQKIITKLDYASLDEQGYVFSIYPTLVKYKKLNQISFSEESYDFNKALLFATDRKLSGIRLYKNLECTKKHSLKISNNTITFYQPSKSKRTKKLLKHVVTMNPKNTYYLFNMMNNSFVKLTSSGNTTIKPTENILDCF